MLNERKQVKCASSNILQGLQSFMLISRKLNYGIMHDGQNYKKITKKTV